MPFGFLRSCRPLGRLAAQLGVMVLIGSNAMLALSTGAVAQEPSTKAEDAVAAPPATDLVRPVKPAKPRIKSAKPAKKHAARTAQVTNPVAPPAPAQSIAAQGPAPVAPGPDVTSQLRQSGAGACAAQINALAAASMGDVAQFNTVSNWATTGGNGRVASVSIAQRYPDGSAVPFGATSVIAAPNGQGSCDALAVQVVPSPLPCAKLRDTIAARGKQIGDLAGVPLMQDVGGQTLLVPTAANTCVLVGLRSAYAK